MNHLLRLPPKSRSLPGALLGMAPFAPVNFVEKDLGVF
jgi:hypothetical protein